MYGRFVLIFDSIITDSRAGRNRKGGYNFVKISKLEAAIALAAAMVLAFTAGWFLRGSRTARPLTVESQRTLTVTVTAYPSPTPDPEIVKLNINTATQEELMTLPGIGEKRAADIVDDRTRNGPFRFPEDITRINGIGEDTLAGLLDYITTDSSSGTATVSTDNKEDP